VYQDYQIDYQGTIAIKIKTASGNELQITKATPSPALSLFTDGNHLTKVQTRLLTELFGGYVVNSFDISEGAVRSYALALRKLEALAAGFDKTCSTNQIEALLLADYEARFGPLPESFAFVAKNAKDKGLFLQLYVANPMNPMLLGRHAFGDEYFALTAWTGNDMERSLEYNSVLKESKTPPLLTKAPGNAEPKVATPPPLMTKAPGNAEPEVLVAKQQPPVDKPQPETAEKQPPVIECTESIDTTEAEMERRRLERQQLVSDLKSDLKKESLVKDKKPSLFAKLFIKKDYQDIWMSRNSSL